MSVLKDFIYKIFIKNSVNASSIASCTANGVFDNMQNSIKQLQLRLFQNVLKTLLLLKSLFSFKNSDEQCQLLDYF